MENEIKNVINAEGAGIAENATNGADNDVSLPAAKNANTGAADTYTHTFKKAFEYEGNKYTTVNFNFGKLTGSEMLAIESEMQANNEYAIDPLLSRNFLCKMASKAGGMGSDALEAMPAKDFIQITNAARNFLIDSGY